MISRVTHIPEGYYGVTPYLRAALWLSFRSHVALSENARKGVILRPD